MKRVELFNDHFQNFKRYGIPKPKQKERQMIEKACEFISEWFYTHPHTQMVCSDEFENIDKLLDRLKKAMEE